MGEKGLDDDTTYPLCAQIETYIDECGVKDFDFVGITATGSGIGNSAVETHVAPIVTDFANNDSGEKLQQRLKIDPEDAQTFT